MESRKDPDISTGGGPIPDRRRFSPQDTIRDIWLTLGLPVDALGALDLEQGETLYKSSFKISHLAQSTIALSALGAALIRSLRNASSIPKVSVPLRHSCLEFQTERLFTIDGKTPPSTWGPIGGLHTCSDGYVRIHDNFPNHRLGCLKLLGLDESASREAVAKEVVKWKKVDLEEAAHQNKLAIYALRSFDEWDALPHASAVSNFPITLRKINNDAAACLPETLRCNADRCLRGLRVVELSRVIAGPVCGKTLAVHGADVLWVTSPNLPDLPSLDRNLARGKRSIQLELSNEGDHKTLTELIKECDVFVQSYRPGSLEATGLGQEALAALKPGIIVANMSAFGPDGHWSIRRGFDSLVQTCTGMNVSEAEHYGGDAAARPMPVQALDYAGGYLLATGISAALYKRAVEGGSWQVDVSLAGVMKYLRSLGQWPGNTGFDFPDPASSMEALPGDVFEERDSAFGRIRGLRHAASVEGAQPGFDFATSALGSDKAEWLSK
jgi:hypothetical protein